MAGQKPLFMSLNKLANALVILIFLILSNVKAESAENPLAVCERMILKQQKEIMIIVESDDSTKLAEYIQYYQYVMQEFFNKHPQCRTYYEMKTGQPVPGPRPDYPIMEMKRLPLMPPVSSDKRLEKKKEEESGNNKTDQSDNKDDIQKSDSIKIYKKWFIFPVAFASDIMK